MRRSSPIRPPSMAPPAPEPDRGDQDWEARGSGKAGQPTHELAALACLFLQVGNPNDRIAGRTRRLRIGAARGWGAAPAGTRRRLGAGWWLRIRNGRGGELALC